MRIILADNRRKVRFALRTLLTQQTDFEIVGEASDARDLLSLLETSCPDALLLDWELPGMDIIELLASLRTLCPGMPVLALSGRVQARRVAMDAGVDAFVSKGDPPERLLSALQSCTQRHTDS
jgi:DNA-binding NarL/FixJ family response regulator